MVFVPAEKFKPVSELNTTRGLVALIYGTWGIGKTTFVRTAQDSEEHGAPLAYLDFEGGTASIADRSDIMGFTPKKYSDLLEFLEWAEKSAECKFKTFAVDTLTDAQRFFLEEAMRGATTPDVAQIQDYGKATELLTRFVRRMRNIAHTRGINAIFTAHEIQVTTDSGILMTKPALSPKNNEGVCATVDLLGYMYKDKEDTRYLQVSPSYNIAAKLRQAPGGKITGKIKNPTLVTLLRALKGEALTEK